MPIQSMQHVAVGGGVPYWHSTSVEHLMLPRNPYQKKMGVYRSMLLFFVDVVRCCNSYLSEESSSNGKQKQKKEKEIM